MAVFTASKTIFLKAALAAGFLLGFFFVFARVASAATLSLSPSTGSHLVGRTFTIAVLVASPDAAMNAAQGALSFPADKLAVISLSKTDSIVNLWVQEPLFSNREGTINFGGVVVNPGFQGASGKLFSVTFQVKNPGTSAIAFSSGSVLANDGKGTNILTGMQGADMTLAPAVPPVGETEKTKILSKLAVASDPPIVDGNWYNLNAITAITFRWTLPAGALGVNYGISNDPGYQLLKSSRGRATSTSYNVSQFGDGVWYFYVRFESGGVWAPVSMLSFQLDRTPPEPFVIVQKDPGLAVLNPTPAFQWAVTDKTSGVASYRAKIGDGDWFDPAHIAQGSLYVLPPQSPTKERALMVRAYDRAGNIRESSISFTIAEACPNGKTICVLWPFFARWGWLLVLVVILLLALAYWILYRVFAWKKILRKELTDFKNELRRDLTLLEKRVDVGVKKGAEIDLHPSHLAAKKEALQEVVRHLEADVQQEIQKIEKMTDEK